MKRDLFWNVGRHFVSKGWGYEDIVVNNEEYCGKILFFKKGKKCSWHYHNKKDETFYLQSGELLVGFSFENHTLDDPQNVDDNRYFEQLSHKDIEYVVLTPGDSFHIPVGMRHYMYGEQDSYLFEFSTQHLEKDSIRIIKGD